MGEGFVVEGLIVFHQKYEMVCLIQLADKNMGSYWLRVRVTMEVMWLVAPELLVFTQKGSKIWRLIMSFRPGSFTDWLFLYRIVILLDLYFSWLVRPGAKPECLDSEVHPKGKNSKCP